MLFQYTFTTQTIAFTHFSLLVRAASNFESVVDGMFERDQFREIDCPYGAALWPASVALGHILCADPALVAGKRVLELGAGLGLGSLVAKRLGADVTASDFHPDMAELFAHNAALNQLKVPYLHLDWADASDAETYDTLIGSDLLYDATLTPLVLSVVARLLRPDGVCVFADPQRGQLERFRQGLKQAGLVATERQQTAGFADQSANCVIFFIRRQ